MTASPFEVVKKVAERVCMDIYALVTGDYESLPEPLRWSMHGGPGTGKTHLINIIKEQLFETRIEMIYRLKNPDSCTSSSYC